MSVLYLGTTEYNRFRIVILNSTTDRETFRVKRKTVMITWPWSWPVGLIHRFGTRQTHTHTVHCDERACVCSLTMTVFGVVVDLYPAKAALTVNFPTKYAHRRTKYFSSFNFTSEIGAFQYTTGKTYQYGYTTQIIGNLPNQPEETTFSLQLVAKVSVLSACTHRLSVTLQNVSDQQAVFSAESIRELKDSLEANSVDFGFYNGKIGEICSAPGESVMALNLKKGILSTLQISATTTTGFKQGTFLEVRKIRRFRGPCFGTIMVIDIRNLQNNRKNRENFSVALKLVWVQLLRTFVLVSKEIYAYCIRIAYIYNNWLH